MSLCAHQRDQSGRNDSIISSNSFLFTCRNNPSETFLTTICNKPMGANVVAFATESSLKGKDISQNDKTGKLNGEAEDSLCPQATYNYPDLSKMMY